MARFLILTFVFTMCGFAHASSTKPCWIEVLEAGQPARLPIGEVVETFRKLPRVRGFEVHVYPEFPAILVHVMTFKEAVFLNELYAISGYKGYGVIVELKPGAPGTPENLRFVRESMLEILTPEGVEEWIEDPTRTLINDFHRARPATFKIAPELRAHLAYDEWKLGGWNEQRVIHFWICETVSARKARQTCDGTVQPSGLILDDDLALQSAKVAWDSVYKEFVGDGRAVVREEIRPRLFVIWGALSFPNREDFEDFIKLPTVNHVGINFLDPRTNH